MVAGMSFVKSSLRMVLTLLVLVVTIGIVYVMANAVSTEAGEWVRDHLNVLIAGIGLIVILAPTICLAAKDMTKYQPGDNPVQVARVLIAYGRKRAAISYLEDALRHHPGALSVLKELDELRNK
jgi:hypothetical protein